MSNPRYKKYLWALISLLFFCFIFFQTSNYPNSSNIVQSSSLNLYDRKVLIVQSYNRDFIHTQFLEEGILSTFKKTPDKISFNYEFLDTKKVFSPGYLKSLAAIFSEKYALESFDAIILCDDDALKFYQLYGQQTWGASPYVVATGINSIGLYPEGINGLTIIEERPNYEKTINLALKQNENKSITTLNFIYDDTTTSTEVRHDLEALVKINYSNLSSNHYFQESPESLRNIVSSADQHNLFFFVLYSHAPDGRSFFYDEVPSFVFKNSQNPVYGLWEFYLGSGIIGGHLASSSKYGESAAQAVLDLWKGKTLPLIIPETGAHQHYIFDYKIMEKYNIQYTPDDSKFINKPESYFQKNKDLIIFFSTIISVLLVIIILLLNIEI